MVRVWNPYVPSKAVAVMEGHAMGVVDIVIHETLGLAISLAKDNIVRVWDLKEHNCVQSIVLKFPSSVNGRLPEHGNFALHLHVSGTMTKLLATSDDYIALTQMMSSDIPLSSEPTTHLAQLCSAIYNPHFKQVGLL